MSNFREKENISTPTNIVDDDFFKELYSNSGLKEVTIAIFFFGTFLGLLSVFGIIWYERCGNHNYRTAINQLFSTSSWIIVAYILLVYIPEGTRYLTGPLNETYCDINNFLKNFLCCCHVLALDCIIVVRYIFIYKQTNFGVVNDDLITAFLQISIVALSLWLAIVKRMSVGRKPLNYYMCSGKNPDEANDNSTLVSVTRKFDTTGILVCVSFVLHIFVFTKIFIYQRKTEKMTQNIELGRMDIPNNGTSKRQRNIAWPSNDEKQNTISLRRHGNIPKSMADLTTQILSLTFFGFIGITTAVMNWTIPEELNEYQNRWLAYSNQIIAIAVAILGISAQYYANNASLPKAIWKKLRDNIHCTSNLLYDVKY